MSQSPHYSGASSERTNSFHSPKGNPAAQQSNVPQHGIIPNASPLHLSAQGDVEGGRKKRNIKKVIMTTRDALKQNLLPIIIIATVVVFSVILLMAIPFLYEETMVFVHTNPIFYLLSYVLFVLVCVTLIRCRNISQSFTMTIVALLILTLAFAYMEMILCVYNSLASILLSLIINSVCCVGAIFFATQTRYELMSRIGALYIWSTFLVTFALTALTSITLFKFKWIQTMHAGLASIPFLCYFLLVVEMIIRGTNSESQTESV